jgi:hypothetical protein
VSTWYLDALLVIFAVVLLLGDNKSSTKAAENGTDKGRSKHIDVSAHFLRGRYRDGSICFFYVPGTEKCFRYAQQKPPHPVVQQISSGYGGLLVLLLSVESVVVLLIAH